MKIFTNDTIRSIDRNTIEREGISSLELIERVAEAAMCEIISRWETNKPVAVFAGPGNNGADALAVSKLLAEQGYKLEVFLFNIGGNRLSNDCKTCRDQLLELGNVDFTEVTEGLEPPYLSGNHLIIDGIFGSGLKSSLTGGFKSLVRHINESNATVVSIDVPSGLFSDWNLQAINRDIIHANLTLAIQFPRLAFFISSNAELVGEWQILDIGLSANEIKQATTNYYLVEQSDIKQVLRYRDEFSSKSDYGNAILIAGSYGMMGAAVLAASGALRAGVGKLLVHSPRCGFNIMQSSVPEAMFDADKDDIIITDMIPQRNHTAVAIGPGIGRNESTIKALEEYLLQVNTPLILDADALNCIAMRPSMLNHIPAFSIITPHANEFDRLFDIQPSAEMRLQKAIAMAHYYNIIIVLKGHYTAIVRPDGKVYFNSSGNAAMATPGSGDVLTGVIAAMVAQGYKPEIAVLIAVYVHGLAGDIATKRHGQYGVIARDIASNIGRAIESIMQNNN